MERERGRERERERERGGMGEREKGKRESILHMYILSHTTRQRLVSSFPLIGSSMHLQLVVRTGDEFTEMGNGSSIYHSLS